MTADQSIRCITSAGVALSPLAAAVDDQRRRSTMAARHDPLELMTDVRQLLHSMSRDGYCQSLFRGFVVAQ
jgi:hypothetical protein